MEAVMISYESHYEASKSVVLVVLVKVWLGVFYGMGSKWVSRLGV